MNSYSIFVGVAHDELRVQTVSPFENCIQLHRTTVRRVWILRYKQSQKPNGFLWIETWDLILRQYQISTPWTETWCWQKKHTGLGLVCFVSCSNTQYSTLVFSGIFVAASLPLVVPPTPLTLSQKKFQVFLQLPLTFLFTCILSG